MITAGPNRSRIAAAALSAVLIGAGAAAVPTALSAAPAVAADPGAPGAVLWSEPLPEQMWIPGTGQAWRLEYVTTGAAGAQATSTGTVFVPEGPAPEGGWPVISWAHGTVGLADQCAPSRTGMGERDLDYLSTWMDQGYAVVATDYAGLGTKGGMPYLDGEVEARNVVDMVTAGRGIAQAQLSERWVVVGQSQGGGAAITTARYATEFGGEDLDYRGAVGTGVPAHIERAVAPAGPGFPPIALPKGMTAYGLYILAGLNTSHPELDLESHLTDAGRARLAQAQTMCLGEFEDEVEGTVLGEMFDRPLADIPGFEQTLTDYMGMPESGFDRPFFIGQGLKDIAIILPATLAYGATLEANGEPVTFRTYPTDHSGTMAASLPDSVPFVADLFAD